MPRLFLFLVPGRKTQSHARLQDGAAQHHPKDQAQREGDAHSHGVGALHLLVPLDSVRAISPDS